MGFYLYSNHTPQELSVKREGISLSSGLCFVLLRIFQYIPVHNDAFFQNFYGTTWIGKKSPFFYHFGITYSPI